jgi:hypothetical protein
MLEGVEENVFRGKELFREVEGDQHKEDIVVCSHGSGGEWMKRFSV